MTSKVMIDLAEKFPHLSTAPIAESVINIRVASDVKWDEIILKNDLQVCLKDYPKIEELREFRYHVGVSQLPDQSMRGAQDMGCVGLKLSSADGLHIVQFNKGVFVFSRLKPYLDWKRFIGEALRLWRIYQDLFKPTVVQRVGVRFINRIPVQNDFQDLGDYYRNPPKELSGLDWPRGGFMAHDVFQVPGTDYAVNIIKTMVPPNVIDKEQGLILDIDAFTQTAFSYSDGVLNGCLEKMRWVKNKIFYACVTDKILDRLK